MATTTLSAISTSTFDGMIEGDTKRGFGRLFGRQCYCPSHQSGPHLHMIQEEMCWIDGLYASSGGMAEAEAKVWARMKVLLEMEAKLVMSKPGGGGSKVMAPGRQQRRQQRQGRGSKA